MKHLFKHLLVLIVVSSMVFAFFSCKKNSTGNGGTWTAKNTTYTANASSRTGNSLVFTDPSHNSTITCTFYGGIPSAGGQFAIDDYTPYNYGEVEIQFFDGTHTYIATDYVDKATLTISGGKVTISFPAIEFDYDNGASIDTLQVAGNLHEI